MYDLDAIKAFILLKLQLSIIGFSAVIKTYFAASKLKVELFGLYSPRYYGII